MDSEKVIDSTGSNGGGVVLPPSSAGGSVGDGVTPPPVRSRNARKFPPRQRGPKEPPSLLMAKLTRLLRLPLGSTPREFRAVSKLVYALRSELENACNERHGGISITRALHVNTAVRAEMAVRYAETLLRRESKNLKPMELMDFQEKTLKFAEKRDKAVMALDLDTDPTKKRNVFATLDAGGGS